LKEYRINSRKKNYDELERLAEIARKGEPQADKWTDRWFENDAIYFLAWIIFILPGILLTKKRLEGHPRRYCFVCGQDMAGLGKRHPVMRTLCQPCCRKQPKKWKKRYKNRNKAKDFKGLDELIQIAKDGSYEKLEITKPKSLIDSAPTSGSFEYMGGHPDFTTVTKVFLKDTSEGIDVFDPKTSRIFFKIKWDKIKNISADSKMQKGSWGLTAFGLLTGHIYVAILGSLLKIWKDKENKFMNISYQIGNMNTVISFKGDNAGEAAAYFINKVGQYVPLSKVPKEPEKPVEKKESPDPMEQMKKLAELKNAGIISEQEFEEKKKELLAKI
jgi:hypothetical protein